MGHSGSVRGLLFENGKCDREYLRTSNRLCSVIFKVKDVNRVLYTFLCLFKVRHEASKCPDIMIASNLTTEEVCSSQTYFVSSDCNLKAPKELQPTIQWQIKQILEFSKLRWVGGDLSI